MILDCIKNVIGAYPKRDMHQEIHYRDCNEVIVDIKETLTQLIEASNYIHNYCRFNRETKKREYPWDDDGCDCNTRVQKIMDAKYDANKNAEIFEFLINEYFHHDPYNWREKIRVEYDERFGTIHVKQPWTKRISKGDPRLSVLKKEINRVRFSKGIGTGLVYKPNLLDFTI